MGASQRKQELSGYRERVMALIGAGKPFETVEEAIDEVDDLTSDQKAALWLFAFSLRDRAGRLRASARAHVAAVADGGTR